MNPNGNWFERLFSTDHRNAVRRSGAGLVAFYWEGTNAQPHEVRNISNTGFYLSTRERWHPGTIITMTLQKSAVAGKKPELYIAVQTKVVRLGEDGVGFTFLNLESHDPTQKEALAAGPVGKKALDRFLDQVLSDQGHIFIGTARAVPYQAPSGGNAMQLIRKSKNEDGQALIITVLSMTVLLGFTALATDVGVLLHEKRLTQTAADAAAMAGESQLANSANITSAGKAAAAQNGMTDGSNGATITINWGPATGPHAGNKSYVEAIVTQVQPTIFMRLFNLSSMAVGSRAVAAYGKTQSCIYTLNTGGPDLSIVGNANITVQTCGIVDYGQNTSGKTAALYLQGSATLNAQSIGIAGGYATTGNVNLTPSTPVTGIPNTGDPLANTPMPPLPPTGCTATPSFGTQGTLNLSAGCYNGISIGSGQTVNLASGIYYINGDLNLQAGATLTGNAVTIVLLGATNMTGTPSLNLSAPTSGTYDGLLFYEPPSNTAPMNLIGTPGSTLAGTVYAPAAAVNLQGNAGATISLNFVVNTLSLIGNATLTDYDQVNPSNILSSVRLVE